MQGNLRGKKGRNWPFWIFQSTGFRAVASSLSKTSSLLGVGTGSSTCCKGKVQRYYHANTPKSMLKLNHRFLLTFRIIITHGKRLSEIETQEKGKFPKKSQE